jgi:hypothetical protein
MLGQDVNGKTRISDGKTGRRNGRKRAQGGKGWPGRGEPQINTDGHGFCGKEKFEVEIMRPAFLVSAGCPALIREWPMSRESRASNTGGSNAAPDASSLL